MRTKYDIKLDYSYINTRAPNVLKIVSDYFEDNFKLNETFEVLPERPQRYNDVGLIYETIIYDKFQVRFSTGENWFSYVLIFYDDPVGFRLRDKTVRPTIDSVLITNNYDEHLHKCFHPTDININAILEELHVFLKYVMKKKHSSPNKNYFEIAFKKVNEINGFDHDKKINIYFEKI